MARVITFMIMLTFGCSSVTKDNSNSREEPLNEPYFVILGVAQDAGYPQAGCYQPHCMRAWNYPRLKRYVTSLALIDPFSQKKWLFDATPDIKDQLFALQSHAPDSTCTLAGIFLTHGHIGHYSGLMHFGRETMGAKDIPVYAMPRMSEYLKTNGPWSQLVELGNIKVLKIEDSTQVVLTDALKVIPFTVPHRDEYTETVGYRITYKHKSLVFIPDIDKWHKWGQDIIKVIKTNDHALLDATFFHRDELPGRNMHEIPHPFVEESIKIFDSLSWADKSKIHFIHFNHSNPLLIDGSKEQIKLERSGFNLARQGGLINF